MCMYIMTINHNFLEILYILLMPGKAHSPTVYKYKYEYIYTVYVCVPICGWTYQSNSL